MRAILADLDGTLVDSTTATERVWSRWRAERGIALPATGHPHGMPAHEVLRLIAPELDPAAAAVEVNRREELDVEGITALPGAAELLAGALGDCAIAIVTGCTLPLARARLRAAKLTLPPGALLVTTERTPRGKPDPAPFLLAAAELGVAPADCVVLEDAPAGVAAGHAAGMHVVAVGPTPPAADEHHPDVAAWLAAVRARRG